MKKKKMNVPNGFSREGRPKPRFAYRRRLEAEAILILAVCFGKNSCGRTECSPAARTAWLWRWQHAPPVRAWRTALRTRIGLFANSGWFNGGERQMWLTLSSSVNVGVYGHQSWWVTANPYCPLPCYWDVGLQIWKWDFAKSFLVPAYRRFWKVGYLKPLNFSFFLKGYKT